MGNIPWILAIDFGTTNTVAVVQDVGDRPRVLQFSGAPLLPSALFLDRDHTWVVGRAAENRALEDPSRFEATPKRRIGDQTLFLGGQDVTVTDAIGAVLDVVVREALRQHGGRSPKRVVLTHPALWQSGRTAVLLQAARRVLTAHVGGADLHLLPEPVAASWHAATAADLPSGCRVAVFDLGGGTLDVALLDLQRSTAMAETFSLAGTPRGVDPLGGEDFDTRLALWALDQVGDPSVGSRLTAPSSSADRAAAFSLRRSAREAKETLSESTRAYVYVPRLPPQLPDGQSVQVSREQFEQLVKGDLEHGTCLLADVIRTAPIGPQLAAVFLVGGSGRIPLLGRLLADATGHNPTEHGDPATAVAEGAARWLTYDLTLPPAPQPELNEPVTDVHDETPDETTTEKPRRKLLSDTPLLNTRLNARQTTLTLAGAGVIGVILGVLLLIRALIVDTGTGAARLMLSTSQVKFDDVYSAAAVGFLPGEGVRFSWTGSTAGLMGDFAADSSGNATHSGIHEVDPPGSYTIIATGLTSGRTASAGLEVLQPGN